MLRTLVIASLLLTPSLVAAQELPASPLGLEIRSDDGTAMGRVVGVERNREGRVVAVDTEGLAPPDSAPNADGDLVAGLQELPMMQASFTREANNRQNENLFSQSRVR